MRESGAAAVTAAFQAYADRGVFRGFSSDAARRRHVYRFSWLTRRPMTARFYPGTRRLSFPDLLPGVPRSSPMGRALSGVVSAWGGQHRPRPPAHKRFEARHASAAGSFRGGAFALVVTIRGTQYAYAVRQALNLVNDLFLLLHEAYPDYLIEHFAASTE